MPRGNLPVDAARIARDLADLAALTEPDRRWTRRAFTPVFLEGRRWLAERMRDAGLDPVIDAAGNLIGRRSGRNPGRGTLIIGSHSDTVPDGGRYDGTAGVITGLEVARALQDTGITLEHDLEIVDFLAEEVSIFGVSCIGSRAMTGQIPADWLEREHQGRSLRQAIVEAGGDPGGLSPRNDIRASLELHIEQGPVLETEGETIGIVTSITGITRIALRVTGRADHAGTTPMRLRDDALVTAAGIVLDIHGEAYRRARDEAGHFTATVGEFTIKPGAANVVPGAAELLIDARASDPGVMTHFVDWLRSKIAGRPVTMQVISDNPPCPCDPSLCLELETAARQLGAKSRRMVSGAGHDTAWISKTAPAAMIFVPCKDGRSHCPEESATPEDIAVGAAVLFETLLAIDGRLAR
ncbi:Zn-dependent hydrolase [Mesorhizobium hawassense]|uniref:Zn-dependent hydrolase n=1 Tax=Mesorhizobium hawassense TaxID=1209954 RepID=A0A330HKB4_9HYPH|nr:Zn-dependent hydrolase [Mesorhizobium hawassense]RAZ89171.1 Zn-dependent hydrolase [Mesorhizobium hawassense]